MDIPYQDILLWGHSYEDYSQMFALSKEDLESAILDCCGGPSSFNVTLTGQGGRVVSTDSLFALNKANIEKRIQLTFDEMLKNVERQRQRFIWDAIASPKELAATRHRNIKLFLNDFEKGKKEGRYLSQVPPDLSFHHRQFDLVLCSHYFFSYAQNQSVEFHSHAIRNLCDVAKEVRIFPLLNSEGNIPDLVGPTMQALQKSSIGVEIKAVPYHFQKKGNALLRAWSQSCEISCDIS